MLARGARCHRRICRGERLLALMGVTTNAASISSKDGISAPTLYAWKRLFQEQGCVVTKRAGNPEHWDGKARVATLNQTAAMNEAEHGGWCREGGVLT